MGQLRQSVKYLNLFKKADDRSEQSIQRQKLITRLYLILLTGMNHLSFLFQIH